ncbi:MAG: hypothetical protein HYX76_08810 [Acidobacteria bacterium]|nr:hypothetical protein [Acidobacteriota bacterium]
MKAVLLAVLIGIILISVSALARGGQAPALDPRVAAYDKGPATIDVSKYPADMQARYKVYAAKCGKCHTLARAVNCDFVLDDEWERYVKRMMRKAGTFISPEDGKQIFEFVSYDSKTRKKDLYERRLKDAGK